MSHCTTKQTKWPSRPVTSEISLGIGPVLPESSLYAQWVAIRTKGFLKRTVKTLIRLGGCPGWSKSSLGTQVILSFFVVLQLILYLSWGTAKDRKWHLNPAKTRISLRICTVWSDFVCMKKIIGYSYSTQQRLIRLCRCTGWAASWQNQQNDCAPNEDRSAWAFADRVLARRTCHFVGFVMRWLRLIWVFAGHVIL